MVVVYILEHGVRCNKVACKILTFSSRFCFVEQENIKDNESRHVKVGQLIEFD